MSDSSNKDDDPRLSKWLGSVKQFLEAWSTVRICPDRINAPQGHSVNVLTLAISVVIFVLARRSIAGSNTSLDAVLIATIISVLIVFGTGYINLILRPGPNSMDQAHKWGVFFIMSWLTSLMLIILVDALPFWLGYTRGTTALFNVLFGPDSLTPIVSDAIRAILFSIAALTIIAYKTKQMDKEFQITERCTIATIAVGLVVNVLLLSGFIYGRLI